jgi:hypothetical protein
VPDPDHDAELGKLRARRAARAGSLGYGRRVPPRRDGSFEGIEQEPAEALDPATMTWRLPAGGGSGRGRLRTPRRPPALLARDLAAIDRLIAGHHAELAADARAAQAAADASWHAAVQ